jgi:DNA-directed RNA polymerase subunit RPC12/RpoP
MAHRYTIEEKVENFFASLRPRYQPFQMHQFCFTCGRELHRSQFKMSLIHKVTNINCKWCVAKWRATGRWPDRQPPPQWESREMMTKRLLDERGTASYVMFGVKHSTPYKTTIAHRAAISRGVIKQRTAKEKK